MKKNILNQSKELDLIFLALILWKDKWKIISITLISTLIFVYNSLKQPITYKISTNIKNANPSSFIKYTTLNKTVLSDYFSVTKDFKSAYLLNAGNLFEFVINEFLDYEEIIYILKKDKNLQNNLEGYSEDELERELANYAKSFKIISPSIEGAEYKLYLEWPNVENGIKIFDEALSISLKNVKKNIVVDLQELALAIEKTNNLKLSMLTTKLDYLEKYIKNVNDIQIKIDPDHKAELYSYNSEYFNLRYQINEIENDFASQQLSENIDIIENDTEKNWVSYNFNFADINSNKRPLFQDTILGILIGLFIGCFYSLFTKLILRLKLLDN